MAIRVTWPASNDMGVAFHDATHWSVDDRGGLVILKAGEKYAIAAYSQWESVAVVGDPEPAKPARANRVTLDEGNPFGVTRKPRAV